MMISRVTHDFEAAQSTFAGAGAIQALVEAGALVEATYSGDGSEKNGKFKEITY